MGGGPAALHGRYKAFVRDETIRRGEFQDGDIGYLGVQFVGTNDLTHYGWISYQATNTLSGDLTGVITGWAYENQAGAPRLISAVPEPTSGTLVLLLCLSSMMVGRRNRS